MAFYGLILHENVLSFTINQTLYLKSRLYDKYSLRLDVMNDAGHVDGILVLHLK